MSKRYKYRGHISHHGTENMDLFILWKCCVPNGPVGVGLGVASGVLVVDPETYLDFSLGFVGKQYIKSDG